MKNHLIATCMLLFVLAVSTVKTCAETPRDFGNRLIRIIDTLDKKLNAWEAKFTEVRESRNFEELRPYRLDIQKYIDRKTAELKKGKPVGVGSAELVKAYITYLAGHKQLLDAYLNIEHFTTTTGDREMYDAADALLPMMKDKLKALDDIDNAETEYFKKNKLKMNK